MVYFEFFDINAMSTCVFVQEQLFLSFVQLLQNSSSIVVVANFEGRGINLEFKPIFVADSIGQVMWTNRSPLSRRFTRLPLNAYFPDLSTLKFPKTAVIRVYCVVSQYQPVSKTKQFSSLELWLEAQRRKQKLLKAASENHHSRLFFQPGVSDVSFACDSPVPDTHSVIPPMLSRPSVESISTTVEVQEQLNSQLAVSCSVPARDEVSPVSVSVSCCSIDFLPRSSCSEISDIPVTTTMSKTSCCACSKQLALFLRVSIRAGCGTILFDKLCQRCGATPLSKFAWIPGKEIPPEPPPHSSVFLAFLSLFCHAFELLSLELF
jgi:hypothetical protein